MATYVNNPQPAESIDFGHEEVIVVEIVPKYEDASRMIKTYSNFRQVPVVNMLLLSGSG